MQQPVSKVTLALVATIAVVLNAVISPARADGTPAAYQRQIVADAAQVVLKSLVRDPEMAPLRDDLRRARAVLVVPQGTRFGTFNAVVLARQGRWWHPAWFEPVAATGLGAGAEFNAQDVVVLALTEAGVRALKAAAGGESGIALESAGASDAADLVAYARGDGAGLGLGPEGVRVAVSAQRGGCCDLQARSTKGDGMVVSIDRAAVAR